MQEQTHKILGRWLAFASGFLVGAVWFGCALAGSIPNQPLHFVSELAKMLADWEDSSVVLVELPEAQGSAAIYTDTDGTQRVMIIGNPDGLDCWRVDTRLHVLKWEAPTHNVDGTPVTDLASYYIEFKNYETIPAPEMFVTPGDSVVYPSWWKMTDLLMARVAAVDSNGNISAWSNTLIVMPDSTWTTP